MLLLEEENRRLKQIVADLALEKVLLQEVLTKSPKPTRKFTWFEKASGSSPLGCDEPVGCFGSIVPRGITISTARYENRAVETVARIDPRSSPIWVSSDACPALAGELDHQPEACPSSLL